MLTRPLKPEDLPHLQAIYKEMGEEYGFPDMLGSEFEEVLVTVDDDGVPLMAMGCRKTVEVFHLMRKGQGGTYDTPKWRWSLCVALHERMKAILRSRGYTDMHAWVPAKLVRSWAERRLCRLLGWQPSLRRCFFLQLGSRG
jgi:hypothetical protein